MTSKTGIVFFSKDGSTRILAKLLGEKHQADVIELVTSEKKSGLLKNALNATKKRSVALVGQPYNDVDGMTKLYLCTPIWASNGSPAMNSFLEKVDLTDKEVVIITVKGYSSTGALKKTHAYLKDVVKKRNGSVTVCLDVHGAGMGKSATESHIKEQIDSLDI